MISFDSSSGKVHECIPFSASPNPIQPKHTLETFKFEFPN